MTQRSRFRLSEGLDFRIPNGRGSRMARRSWFHKGAVVDQIWVLDWVGIVNSDGGWEELAVTATLWWVYKAEAVHQGEKVLEHNRDITVNRREQHGIDQAMKQSQITEMIIILLLTPFLKLKMS
jgi:hypothetical protein